MHPEANMHHAGVRELISSVRFHTYKGSCSPASQASALIAESHSIQAASDLKLQNAEQVACGCLTATQEHFFFLPDSV